MVDAVDPFLPKPIYQYRKSKAKIAPPDIILDEENISIESMSDYIFDEIGGQELLLTARSYTIDSPLNINNTFIENSGSSFGLDLDLPFDTIEATLKQYQINLDSFLPADYIPEQVLYYDETTGSLVIELENLKPSYRVEIKIIFGQNTKFGIIDEGSEIN